MKSTTDDDGTIHYYNEAGQLHRDDDEPAVIYATGEKAWFINGVMVRRNYRILTGHEEKVS